MRLVSGEAHVRRNSQSRWHQVQTVYFSIKYKVERVRGGEQGPEKQQADPRS